MDIICMGDSITYGYGLEDDLSRRWTDLAAARTGHRLVNRGVNGDTTAGMLARCQTQVFPLRPGAMVLLGGVNDISYTGQYRPACANVAAMVKQSLALGIPVIVGLPTPIAAEDMRFAEWDLEQDNRRTAELCGQYARWLSHYCADRSIPVADFRGPFFLEGGIVRHDLLQDGLHPTAEGHRLMADVLCRVLEEHFA